jgi:putative ABC transport system permease protein
VAADELPSARGARAALRGADLFFFTYLRREMRRRMRQTIFVALGLAVGVGLVIVVTAATTGVKDAQTTVLHSLYGVGTDVTVTKAPAQGSGNGFGFSVGGGGGRPSSGKFSRDTLRNVQLGTLSDSSVTSIARLHGVAASAGSLVLNDLKISGTVPTGGFSPGQGNPSSSITTSSFAVEGTDIGTGQVGPLSSAKLTSGRTFSSSDANSDVAVLDANYATQNSLKVGSKLTVAGTSFTVIGIVSQPASSSTQVYVPLARAQALASLKNDVNTIYVAATSASQTGALQNEIKTLLPSATVTSSSSLASQVTGSLASAASLATNLGKWLAVAVLAAAFAMASLLTMAGVARRVREFGTLKALGWRSRRVIGQVMGEAITIGVLGAVIGAGIGYGGAKIVSAVAPSLTATVGQTTGSGTPGGAGQFGGGGSPFRRLAGNTSHTVSVHLTAPVTVSVIAGAAVLAIAGGVIAGSFGGWRAARLSPASALASVA